MAKGRVEITAIPCDFKGKRHLVVFEEEALRIKPESKELRKLLERRWLFKVPTPVPEGAICGFVEKMLPVKHHLDILFIVWQLAEHGVEVNFEAMYELTVPAD